MSPDISVVVAVYNEQRFVREAIESILANDEQLIEVIVVDDQSTDGTAAIVAEMAAADQRVRYFLNAVKGKVSAFNLGVSKARGRHICLFAGDDTMPRGSLACRSAVLESVPETRAAVVLCKLVVMSDDPRANNQVIPRASGKGTTSGSTMMFNRKALERCFPTPDVLPNEDSWLALCVTYLPDISILHTGVIGCNYRMHEGNSISVMEGFDVYSRKFALRRKANNVFLEKFGEHLTDAARKEIEAKIALESARIEGKWLRIMFLKCGTVDKLRAISIISPTTLRVRKKLFRLFSGW